MNSINILCTKCALLIKQNLILVGFLSTAMVISFVNLNQEFPGFQSLMATGGDAPPQLNNVSPVPYDVVFVSRRIRKNGSVYVDSLNDLAGVGVHGHFREYAPGKLQIYTTNGNLITLIDGSNPTIATLNLIDVNAPDVSYDGTEIVFAGLPAPPPGTVYDSLPSRVLGAWRIYKINVNGTGLTQLTNSSQNLNLSQFNMSIYSMNYLGKYDDTDPCWLPDGRICFSSTRYPVYCQYGSGRATNLHVMNNNGTAMHRITSERNSADQPMVDPVTGQIVFSRWWRNYRFPVNSMSTVFNADSSGYILKNGLSSDKNQQVGGSGFMIRNAWHVAAINPDGTGLHIFAGGGHTDGSNQAYGGSFTTSGDLITNYYPTLNLFEVGGLGGIRKHVRGPGRYVGLIGLTDIGDATEINAPPATPSTHTMLYSVDGYATDPDVLPDDRMILSYASNYVQDYGLFVTDSDGTGKTLIYDNPGTQELRAVAIRPRTIPPIITDQITQVASMLPPLDIGPYNIDGTFVFNCLNVYSNAPVDFDIPNAPGIGTAASIRFFIDHQRKTNGAKADRDFPILLNETAITPGGMAFNNTIPANVSLFEQIRTPLNKGYKVPFTGVPFNTGTGHVGGMNYGRPGEVATCVGCHRGHSMMAVPAIAADAEWTNLAPGATSLTFSSSRKTTYNSTIVNRRVMLDYSTDTYWVSSVGNYTNQWTKLGFDVPIKIRSVKLYNIPFGSKASSTIQVNQVVVELYSDKAALQLITQQTLNAPISANGTDVFFTDVVAKAVKIRITGVTGKFYGSDAAGLAEVEIIASGNTSSPRIKTPVAFNATINPNPVKEIATLQIVNALAENLTYSVYDVSGKNIFTKSIHVDFGNTTTEQLNLNSLKCGVYFLKTDCGGEQKVLRFLKM